MLHESAKANYDIFRECLSGRLIEKLTPEPTKSRARRPRKEARHQRGAVHLDGDGAAIDSRDDERTKPEELAEFIEVSTPCNVVWRVNNGNMHSS